jgi:hypothetical protein
MIQVFGESLSAAPSQAAAARWPMVKKLTPAAHVTTA